MCHRCLLSKLDGMLGLFIHLKYYENVNTHYKLVCLVWKTQGRLGREGVAWNESLPTNIGSTIWNIIHLQE